MEQAKQADESFAKAFIKSTADTYGLKDLFAVKAPNHLRYTAI
jgi:hypothetical protein